MKKFAAVKHENKVAFADFSKQRYGAELDANTMFDTMIKRLHEYKRKALKILEIIATYSDIKSGKVNAHTSRRAPTSSVQRPPRVTTSPR